MKKKTVKKGDVKKCQKALPDWERLLSAQVIFQSHFPASVLVGGTAAALHVGHRISIDADHILPDLKEHFDEILARVEQEAGWKTNRMIPPVLILGHFHGVQTGIRQLMRKKPLETTRMRGLRVPTIAETLRIKAYLIVKRNTTRDYIDFAALFDHLGTTQALQALISLDDLYPQENTASVLQQLAMQLAEPKPWDLSQTDLRHYKSLKAPYTDWHEITRRINVAGLRILEALIE